MNYSITILFYNVYLTYAVPYLIANATRFGLTTEITDQLTAFLALWIARYNAYINPATHSTITIGDMNDLFKIVSPFTDGLKQSIKNRSGLVLNSMDYLTLEINRDSPRRNRIPRPSQLCGAIVVAFFSLLNRIALSDLANPRKGAKPKDVARIGIKELYLKATDPVPTLADLVRVADQNSMDIEILSSSDQVGKVCYLAFCFLNERGEEGDYSAIIHFTVI